MIFPNSEGELIVEPYLSLILCDTIPLIYDLDWEPDTHLQIRTAEYGLIEAYFITQQTSYVRLAGERGRSCMVILYGIFIAAFGIYEGSWDSIAFEALRDIFAC